MQTAPFTVMDASAGSGKTRNLVKAVLLQALAKAGPETALKPVMAMTFTNKAAAEMKGRLLEYLIDFASAAPKETGLLAEISAELNLPENKILERAKQLLKYLLHHYNDLSFGTIDSFTSRLVRTFAKDLALAENFEIILDLNKLLAETTDHVINQAGQDEKLTKMLVAFVEQKLEDEKSWSIDSALTDMAKKLLEERHREPLARLRDFTPEDFEQIRLKLGERRRKLISKIETRGTAGLEVIQNLGIEASSFANGASGFSNFFNYLAETRFDKCLNFTDTVQKNIDKDNWYSGKATSDQKSLIDSCKHELLQLALEGKELANQHAPFILLSEKIIKNTYALATLSALDQALHSIEEAQNILPLAAFNHIINSKIKDEPAPYIFERLGERYKHFYIDEFQDTSKMQWENIFPLIENGLASTGTALLVGDAKQSIYRWRNGEAEQFIDLSKKASEGQITPAIPAKTDPLDSNWRSLETVVNFNNALFTFSANFIQDEGYKKLYNEATQKVKKAAGGYVEVKTLPAEDFVESALQYTLTQIDALLAEGFRHRDIALLVRSNFDGSTLVQELSTRGYPVISGDSLLLGKSYEGKLLSGLIALRTAPKNPHYRWALADGLLTMKIVTPPNGAFDFAFNLVNYRNSVLEEMEKHFEGISALVNAPTDLYTYLRQVCLLLHLEAESNAFTEAFLQAIHDFVERENGTGYEFISWWEEKGCKIAISAPEQMDAIRVATIHKSKGLQYPVVIIPFTKWNFKEKSREAWLNLDPEMFEGLTEMLLPISKGNADIIGGEYLEKYTQLEDQEKFDSLNMLYVACTRAEERLYVVGKLSATETAIFKVVNDFVLSEASKKIDDETFAWGEKTPRQNEEKTDLESSFEAVEKTGWQSKVKLALNAPKNWEQKSDDARAWGNRVHFVLSRIKTAADVRPVLHQLKMQGTLQTEELDKLEEIITAVISHEELKNSFALGTKVYNERDIILPNASIKRPDRISLLASGKVVLLDYKTGEAKGVHEQQLAEYAELLKECGLEVGEKHLVYINEAISVQSF